MLFYSYVFLPATQQNDWLDLLRIYRVGSEADPAFSSNEVVAWKDPLTGFSYVAKRFGDESIFGKTYDKGVGAKMLQWANYLSSLAYQPANPNQKFDPATGRFLYATDARGQPIVVGDIRLVPSDPRTSRARTTSIAPSYATIAGSSTFRIDVAQRIWAPLPCLNGIYDVNYQGECAQ